MNSRFHFLAVVFFALLLSACSRGHNEDIVIGPYTPSISSPIKISVTDVSNDTHEVFSVDVIGLFWNGLEDSLRKRGMLWTAKLGGKPYSLEAHILKYKEGSAPARLLPYAGDTVLVVRCELRDGGREIATIEAKRKIGFGSSTLSRGAWRKIFSDVAEDVITQATKKL